MGSKWPLLCPHCGAGLEDVWTSERLRALQCPQGHHFDASRQGYVNLLAGRPVKFTPDSAAMIMARERVQNAGIFNCLTEVLADLAAPLPDDLVLDCGAGTGHYLKSVLQQHPSTRGIALDLSPAGLKRAAKHSQTLALVWDVWRPLPLTDSSVDILLNVFAPRNPAEYRRVLAAGGRAIVVVPRSTHLHELQGSGLLNHQQHKLHQLQEQMAPAFGVPDVHRQASATVSVTAELAADLVLMGPAGHHRGLADVQQALAHRSPESVTVDLDLLVWRSPG